MGRNKDTYRREQAFRLYCKTRNVTRVSEELDIPAPTLFTWKKEDKWDERIQEVTSSIQEQIIDPTDASTIKSDADNEAVRNLSEGLADEINSLTLMSQTADAAVATKFKDLSLQQVIKIKEFVAKQRILLLHELKDNAKEQGEAASNVNTKDLEEKIAECVEMRRLIDRLDPGWDKELETPSVPAPITANVVKVAKAEFEFVPEETDELAGSTE